MRDQGTVGRHLRKRKRTTVPGRTATPVPDLIERDFTATALDTRWCGDITYIPVGSSWFYLATVIDICSRLLVGWSIADHMRVDASAQVGDKERGPARPVPLAVVLQPPTTPLSAAVPHPRRVRTETDRLR
jgi:transposase InsO family protein